MVKSKKTVRNKSKSKPLQKIKAKKLQNVIQGLNPGDLIDIVAPGSAADFEVLKKACVIIESWGYKTRFQSDLLKPNLMYLANTDEYRFKDLKRALMAKDSKAIWCFRGGYGSLRLLPYLAKLKKPSDKKLFMGLSDITSLHIFLNQKWNWPTVHGPLVGSIGREVISESNLNEVKVVLEGSVKQFEFTNLKPITDLSAKVKSISGPVTGGNLMVVTSTLGTPDQISGAGKILFFEELNERSYRVDRCLQQMRQAGVFKGVKAVVFGDFLQCLEADGKDYITPTLKNFFTEIKVAAFTGIESGHGAIQRPVFFNTDSKIMVSPVDKTQFTMVNCSPYEILQPRK